jgi:hypothetical protein
MIAPPRWSKEELDEERARAQELFRQERMQEPLEQYLEAFDEHQGHVEDLLETTIDLSKLDDGALDVLTNPKLIEAFRYLSGPPVSEDDLKVLAESVLTPSRLRSNPDMVRRIIEVIRVGLDRRRFPWVAEGREPTEAERSAAVIASAALIAYSRTSTQRRNEGKEKQETLVEEALLGAQLKKVPTRKVETLNLAPKPGEFCRESYLGTRKADFIIGLHDHRLLAVECKVSNSSTNSIKRLNNDAAAKAEDWLREFGRASMVPAAVLSGVYKLRNLISAQERGLTLFWAHGLPTMIQWINSTRRS